MQHQRNRDQEHIEGVLQDHAALKGEDDNKREQQTNRGDAVELGHEFLVEEFQALALDQHRSSDRPSGQRDDHKKDNGKNQGVPGDLDLVDAQQKGNPRHKKDDDQQIVHRDLHQGVGRIAFGEVAPHKDHRGAGSHTQQNRASHVIACPLGGDEGFENDIKEEGCQAKH